MTLNKQLKELVAKLKENTVVSVILPGDVNIKQFQRKLSVVKTRENLEGKLDFSVETLDEEFMLLNYKKKEKGFNLTIVLLPYQDKTQILEVKTGEL